MTAVNDSEKVASGRESVRSVGCAESGSANPKRSRVRRGNGVIARCVTGLVWTVAPARTSFSHFSLESVTCRCVHVLLTWSAAPRSAAVPMTNDLLRIEQDRSSLARAESDFSALAQELGLGPAFARFGDPQAMHVNAGPANPNIVRGVVEISRSVGEGSPESSSPVTWAADHRTIIARSSRRAETSASISGSFA